MRQTREIENLTILSMDPDHKEFMSRVMELGWLVQTRPEILCTFSMVVQLTESYLLETQTQKIQTLK